MFCSFIKKYFDSSEIDHPISVICFPLKKCYIFFIIFINLNDVLVGCVLHPIKRGHLQTAPPLTVPCKGREARLLHHSHRKCTPGRRVAVQYMYTTAAPHKLHSDMF